jgi:hypothetical protein
MRSCTPIEPEVSARAVEQLKFADLLPPAMATATLAARFGDHETAGLIVRRAMLTRLRG